MRITFPGWLVLAVTLLPLPGIFATAWADTLTYSYDVNGRLVKADYGGGNSLSYAYDRAGNLVSLSSRLPQVATTLASVGDTGVLAGGTVTSTGGATLTGRGVCWSSLPNPTTADSCMADGAATTGSFSLTVTGLTPNSRYHLRAYASSSWGTSYGGDVEFASGVSVTTAAGAVVLSTNCPACSFSVVKAFTPAQLAADPQEYGFPFGMVLVSLLTPPGRSVDLTLAYPAGTDLTGHLYRTYAPAAGWSNLSGATVSGTRVTLHLKDDGAGDSTPLPSLLVNLGGVALAPVLPTVTTTVPATELTTTSARVGGNLVSKGRAKVSARGVCVATTANPTVQDRCVSVGPGEVGTFSAVVSGLTPATLYHMRAYATNVAGTGYGADATFTTLTPVPPTLTTSPVGAIRVADASGGGVIGFDGGMPVTSRGICWSTAANPTLLDTCDLAAGTGTGAFSGSLTGLKGSTLYHVRAYATNSAGTGYGNDLTFTTSSGTGPFAYIDSGDGETVTVIDTRTGIPFGPPIAMGNSSLGFAITPDGSRVYATNLGDGNVAVVDARSSTVTGSRIAVGAWPAGVALNPAGTRAYVANLGANSVSVIDTATSSVIGSPIPVGSGPYAVAVNNSGGEVYVSNGDLFQAGGGDSITIINVASGATSTVAVGKHPLGMALNPAGTRLYVVNSGDNSVSVMDTSSHAIIGSPIPVGANPIGIAINPAGTKAYVTCNGDNGVSVVDLASGTVTGSPVTVGAGPSGVALNPAGTRLYVVNPDGASVSILDLTATPPGLLSTIAMAGGANALGKFIGPPVNFTPPTVTTTATVSSLAATSAVSGGSVTASGGSAVGERGICWSTGEAPVRGGNCQTAGSGTGAFTAAMGGLSPATPYRVRAYAVNASGTSYGAEVRFTTPQVPQKTLGVTLAGSGDGTVTSTPGGISCTGADSPCSAPFASGTSVTLLATPDVDSLFSSWSLCAGTGSCTLTMDADRALTATFSYVKPVKVVSGGLSYDLLQEAFNALTVSGVILARERLFPENGLVLDRAGLQVVLKGGYDTAFAGNAGSYSLLQGSLTVKSGSLTVEQLAIR